MQMVGQYYYCVELIGALPFYMTKSLTQGIDVIRQQTALSIQ